MSVCDWNRPALKRRARFALGGERFGRALGVAVTANILSEIISELLGGATAPLWKELAAGQVPDLGRYQNGILLRAGPPVAAALLVLDILLFYPLHIGEARFFVRNRFLAGRYQDVWSGFGRSWLKGSLTLFTTNLLVLLWMLLLVVPGVVKSYEYRMVPYLLSDNPGLDASRARQLSRELTDFQKGRLFLLDLSFLGWMFLNSLLGESFAFLGAFWSSAALAAGSLLLGTYISASYAEAYVLLRDSAIGEGRFSPRELTLA